MQYEHAGLAPLWPMLETALLSPEREAWLDAPPEPLLHYADREVRIALLSPDGWRARNAAPASGRQRRRRTPAARIRALRGRQRQFAAVLMRARRAGDVRALQRRSRRAVVGRLVMPLGATGVAKLGFPVATSVAPTKADQKLAAEAAPTERHGVEIRRIVHAQRRDRCAGPPRCRARHTAAGRSRPAWPAPAPRHGGTARRTRHAGAAPART